MNMIPSKARRINKDFRYRNMRYSMSLFVIYFGTRREYKDCGLVHHNIILSQRYEELLEDIFKRKIVADDFSLYLHMPTYTDPSIAPPGTESFYVLSPVPHLDAADVDWTTFAPIYKERILKFLEENYLPGLRENHRRDLYRPAALPEHAQQLQRRGLLARADPDPVRLVPPAQPLRRLRQPVLCRRGHAPGRGHAGRALLVDHRREPDPGPPVTRRPITFGAATRFV
jgi:hypothetical protein